ncbi:uncharacterized protein LOC128673748 isoform X2 [Plodia interpunctella]|uniref:uncharacterized protein LOC128673748 isoform X2 n=1 Tax=Plodia interpunctella TaxID=58824 RepID=UPI0023676E5C|nr:uncharacterized protein LOC128673748 isoform X2 [Plodia interpunctella]
MTLKHKIMSNNVSQFFSILAPLFLSTLISMECRYCPTTPEEFQRYQNEYMWIKLYGRDDPSDDLGSFRNGHHTSGEENVIKTEEEKRGDDNKKYDDLYKLGHQHHAQESRNVITTEERRENELLQQKTIWRALFGHMESAAKNGRAREKIME